jgi:N-acylneuraminate cytidylyltransferase
MDDMVDKKIAIIPARGGSKRLLRKNILDFYGKPMIAWTIDAALKTNLFEVVLVSTDCKEIAQISRDFGAEVPFLRIQHTDDFSTASQATLAALTQMEEYCNGMFDTVIQLMPNCPLRTSQSIFQQVKEFENNPIKSSVLSGFKYGMFNPWWAHRKDENGNYVRLIYEFENNIRSQDLDRKSVV